ncbi:MAG: hypothetical protein KC619_34350, partial [Myxococcales bacterium]|nr:hypothetical protein [Myxococcales bacterium]
MGTLFFSFFTSGHVPLGGGGGSFGGRFRALARWASTVVLQLFREAVPVEHSSHLVAPTASWNFNAKT